MKPAQEKYIPFVPLKMEHRTWPDKQITKAPIWCSVDLRDGNQALIDPMNVREKLELFHTLVDIGVKEIEVGFPSASETEYEFIRTLIEGGKRGFIKLVFHKDSHALLGAQLCCYRASDLIDELTLAVTLGLTAEQLLRPVRPHPSFAEAISEAVEAAFPLS